MPKPITAHRQRPRSARPGCQQLLGAELERCGWMVGYAVIGSVVWGYRVHLRGITLVDSSEGVEILCEIFGLILSVCPARSTDS